MKTTVNRLSNRGAMSLLTAAAVLAVGLVAFPSTALADKGRDQRGKESSRRHDRDDHKAHKRDDRRRHDVERNDHRRYDHRRHDDRRPYLRGHDLRRHDSRRYDHYDRVPSYIYRNHRSHYEPYYHGRSYYKAHRHYHSLYRFPVFVGGHVVYQSYPYCGDDLYLSGPIVVPRLAISFGFGGPFPPPPGGFVIGGYYSR